MKDPVITAYRCHGWAYTRGIPINNILAELTGVLAIIFLQCSYCSSVSVQVEALVVQRVKEARHTCMLRTFMVDMA